VLDMEAFFCEHDAGVHISFGSHRRSLNEEILNYCFQMGMLNQGTAA
jgi:hypothetical protein